MSFEPHVERVEQRLQLRVGGVAAFADQVAEPLVLQAEAVHVEHDVADAAA